MRRLMLGLACLLASSCGKAPDNSGPGDAVAGASGIAFAYHYDFRLPSRLISDAQEVHAQACEKLRANRCRITGMAYRVDGSGQVSANLDVQVASSLARGFGRTAVGNIERVGGALTGAEITGTDTAAQMDTALQGTTDARDDLAEIDRQLAQSDLAVTIRRDLVARRAELIETRREGARAMTDAEARTSTTPISFNYHAGTGVGLGARLSEAVQAGYASLTWTLGTVLMLLAYLGPPLVLVLLLALFWHRLGRKWWYRAFPRTSAD